jgi:hypothetical protein
MNQPANASPDLPADFCIFRNAELSRLVEQVRTAAEHIEGNGPGLYFAFDEDVYLMSSRQPSLANGHRQDYVDAIDLDWQQAEQIVGQEWFSIWIPLDVLDRVLPGSEQVGLTRLPTGEVLLAAA